MSPRSIGVDTSFNVSSAITLSNSSGNASPDEYSSGDAFPEEFESVIAELTLNEVSTPIDLGDTLHLIKLTEVLK